MIGTNLLSGWGGIVETAALLAIAILALCVIVGAVRLNDVLLRLGAILCVTILLIMLPAIMASLWAAMTFRQHLGALILGALTGLLLRAMLSARKTR